MDKSRYGSIWDLKCPRQEAVFFFMLDSFLGRLSYEVEKLDPHPPPPQLQDVWQPLKGCASMAVVQ